MAAEPLISPLAVEKGNPVLNGFDEKGVSTLDLPEDLVQLPDQRLDDSCRKAIHSLPGHRALKDDQDVSIALLGKLSPGKRSKKKDKQRGEGRYLSNKPLHFSPGGIPTGELLQQS